MPPLLYKAPPKVPVNEERTQKDKVTEEADAVPKTKSAVLKPSIACRIKKISEAPTVYADKEVTPK